MRSVGKRGPGTYGLCPDCGRIVAGRADGIQRRTTAKRWVLLGPHNRPESTARHKMPCLTRGARRRVPRVTRQKETAAVP